MVECAFRVPPQCGAWHLYAERDGEGGHTRMGTDGNALLRCTDTGSVNRDRFEGLLTEPDTMGAVTMTEGLAFPTSPRDVLARHSENPGAAHPRDYQIKYDVYCTGNIQVPVGT